MIRRRARTAPAAPRPLDLTITLTPRAGTAAAAAASTGVCTPAITGLQWCLYGDSLNPLVSDGGSPATYTMTETTEVPVCSSEDIAITVSGGYVPSDQDGTYVFSLAGDTCGLPVVWEYSFVDHPTPGWSGHMEPRRAGDDLQIPVSGSVEYAKGTATIMAACNGQTYGPILIVITDGY